MNRSSNFKKNQNKGAKNRSPILKKRLLMKKITDYGSKILIVFLGLLGISILGLLIFNKTESIQTYLTQKTHDGLGKLGFVLDDIIVEGREKIPLDVFKKSLPIAVGRSIFEVSLDTVKENVQHIDWIKHVTIHRQLPNQIFIKIQERNPIAIWFDQSRAYGIDDMGVAVSLSDLSSYQDLPKFIGDQAPEHIQDLLTVLKEFPLIQPNITSYVRIRNRRWDLIFHRSIHVKLPEEENIDVFKRALSRLVDLIQKNMIDPDRIESIDLRVHDRVFIKKKTLMPHEK